MPGNLLIVRVGERLCGLPVEVIEEIMRPLPWELIAGGPAYLRGVSVVRGRSIPVVDLGQLLGSHGPSQAQRLVSLRVDGERRVGLLVDEVLGLRSLPSLGLEPLPPLLQGVDADLVEGLGRLDGHLLSILRAASALPDKIWQSPSDGGEHA